MQLKRSTKKAYLATLGGPVVYSELKLLYPNTDLNTIAYRDMISKLKARFDKVAPDIIQRLNFNNRMQQKDESVEDFVLAVKLQAEFCTFGDYKSIAIRDRVIAGIRDKALQQRLLNEENLTLATAEKIIATWEVAGANSKGLADNNVGERIATIASDNKLDDKRLSKLEQLLATMRLARAENVDPGEGHSRGPVKSRLGYRQDTPRRQASYNERSGPYNPRMRGDWRGNRDKQKGHYADLICDFCGIKGHIKRKCFKLKNMKRDAVNFVDQQNPEPSRDDGWEELFNKLKADDSESEDDWDAGDFECMNVTSSKNNPCLIDVVVDGKNLQMEVDCGASVSVIGKNQFLDIFNKPLVQCERKLVVVNGDRLKIEGEANVLVEFRGTVKNLKILVLNSDYKFIPLMGRTWLDIFFPEWRNFFTNIGSINSLLMDKAETTVNEIKQTFSNVFIKDFTQPIRGYEAELVLKSDVPIFKKAYTVPYRLRDKVLDYLNKLEEQNVITPVQTSEWASPVVIVTKKNNDIRLVIDCKVSINKVIIPNTYPPE
ncbi:uncharacterized protein K02A2.6-like [Aedes albopictus]|uniref:CCHC-type domain-containing protein n=1 Tax=Aedes albopictus TaxID=7160 RepID=A0ABM1YTP0_AEDAL